MAKNVKWKSQISLPVPATDDTEAVRLKEINDMLDKYVVSEIEVNPNATTNPTGIDIKKVRKNIKDNSEMLRTLSFIVSNGLMLAVSGTTANPTFNLSVVTASTTSADNKIATMSEVNTAANSGAIIGGWWFATMDNATAPVPAPTEIDQNYIDFTNADGTYTTYTAVDNGGTLSWGTGTTHDAETVYSRFLITEAIYGITDSGLAGFVAWKPPAEGETQGQWIVAPDHERVLDTTIFQQNSSGAWTIKPNGITVDKIEQVDTETLLGRATAGTGNVEKLTKAQASAMLSGVSTSTALADVASTAPSFEMPVTISYLNMVEVLPVEGVTYVAKPKAGVTPLTSTNITLASRSGTVVTMFKTGATGIQIRSITNSGFSPDSGWVDYNTTTGKALYSGIRGTIPTATTTYPTLGSYLYGANIGSGFYLLQANSGYTDLPADDSLIYALTISRTTGSNNYGQLECYAVDPSNAYIISAVHIGSYTTGAVRWKRVSTNDYNIMYDGLDIVVDASATPGTTAYSYFQTGSRGAQVGCYSIVNATEWTGFPNTTANWWRIIKERDKFIAFGDDNTIWFGRMNATTVINWERALTSAYHPIYDGSTSAIINVDTIADLITALNGKTGFYRVMFSDPALAPNGVTTEAVSILAIPRASNQTELLCLYGKTYRAWLTASSTSVTWLNVEGVMNTAFTNSINAYGFLRYGTTANGQAPQLGNPVHYSSFRFLRTEWYVHHINITNINGVTANYATAVIVNKDSTPITTIDGVAKALYDMKRDMAYNAVNLTTASSAMSSTQIYSLDGVALNAGAGYVATGVWTSADITDDTTIGNPTSAELAEFMWFPKDSDVTTGNGFSGSLEEVIADSYILRTIRESGNMASIGTTGRWERKLTSAGLIATGNPNDYDPTNGWTVNVNKNNLRTEISNNVFYTTPDTLIAYLSTQLTQDRMKADMLVGLGAAISPTNTQGSMNMTVTKITAAAGNLDFKILGNLVNVEYVGRLTKLGTADATLTWSKLNPGTAGSTYVHDIQMFDSSKEYNNVNLKIFDNSPTQKTLAQVANRLYSQGYNSSTNIYASGNGGTSGGSSTALVVGVFSTNGTTVSIGTYTNAGTVTAITPNYIKDTITDITSYVDISSINLGTSYVHDMQLFNQTNPYYAVNIKTFDSDPNNKAISAVAQWLYNNGYTSTTSYYKSGNGGYSTGSTPILVLGAFSGTGTSINIVTYKSGAYDGTVEVTDKSEVVTSIQVATNEKSIDNGWDTTGSVRIDKPNTWAVGTEYDFGDGLYGQRLSGTKNISSMSGEGMFYAELTIGATYTIVGTAVISAGHFLFTSPSFNAGNIALCSSASRTNLAYDVWVTYTK
jgi:hypothetical protein